VELSCVASAAGYHAVLISGLEQIKCAVALHTQVVTWINGKVDYSGPNRAYLS